MKFFKMTACLMAAVLVLCACSSKPAGSEAAASLTEKSEVTQTEPKQEVQNTVSEAVPVSEPEKTPDAAVVPETTPEPAAEATTEAVQEETAEAVPELIAPEPTPFPENESWYEDMLNASVMSTGNNYRLKMAIDKARRGEDVYIATIGGSVTEGAGAKTYKKGYAYLFRDAFVENYTSDNGEHVHFVNAGLSGTPSSLGIMRYERDVKGLLGSAPDILIIEFSVNDSGECTKGEAYESMIRKALSENEDCAVILVFAVFKTMWNMQDTYKPVGEYYGLPMVSIKNAIKQPYEDDNLNHSLFFSDDYHPTSYGHQIMCDCIMRMLACADKEELSTGYSVPETSKKDTSYVNTVLLTSKSETPEVTVGSFSEKDRTVQSMNFTGKASFPDNWMHKEGTEPLTFEINCKKLLLNYKTSNSKSYGYAEFYVDGTLVKEVNGYSSGGWNNCNTILLIDEDEMGLHTVEVRMSEGDEDKSFTVLGFAYTLED